ncbi:MAG TPA: plastocyanin/azurin family copper-binding protein [Vicinamibacterales bacterium]|jgi:azurin
MFLPVVVSIVLASAPMSASPAPRQSKPAADQSKPAAPQGKPAAAAGARVVELTGGDDMKYNVTTINAKPGETLRIRLVSKGTLPKIAMAHNVVVLKAGAKQLDFVNAAATARDTDYIPAAMKDQVLAATTLAGPGETVETTFKVPAAGTYPFLCTFPGHFAAGMKGTIVAK